MTDNILRIYAFDTALTGAKAAKMLMASQVDQRENALMLVTIAVDVMDEVELKETASRRLLHRARMDIMSSKYQRSIVLDSLDLAVKALMDGE